MHIEKYYRNQVMYRILYIDDEPSLLEIAKLFLERSNDFSVDIDTSAEQALHTIGTAGIPCHRL